MRKAARLVVVCVVALTFASVCWASDEDYALIPGAAFTLTVDQSVNLQLVTVGDGGIHQIDMLDKVAWTVNGKPPGSDSSEGTLTIPLTLTSATYKAPHTVPKESLSNLSLFGVVRMRDGKPADFLKNHCDLAEARDARGHQTHYGLRHC